MPRTKFFRQSDVDAAEAKAKKTGKLVKVHVFDVPHLYLITTPNGVTRYAFRYTVPPQHQATKKNGEERKQPVTETSVGKPGITLDRAKAIAAKFNELLRDGRDPLEMKQAAVREGTTFAQAAEQWFKINQEGKSQGWHRNIKLVFETYTKPLANLPLIQITPEKIRQTFASLNEKHPRQAQRANGLCYQVLQYAIANRLLPLIQNPADWEKVQRHLFKKVPKKSKPFAGLPHQEIPEFMREVRRRQERSVSAWALEFAILCAGRTSEALEIRWDEIDWDQKVWNIPAERMKARKKHRVPLSNRAMEIVTRREEYRSGDFVFTGNSDNKPLSEKSLRAELYAMGFKGRVTVHGFRKSFRNWAAENKFDFTASEICIAHAAGSKVQRTYLTTDMLDERRDIMQAWADYCGSSSTPSAIISLVA
jgi:integrase